MPEEADILSIIKDARNAQPANLTVRNAGSSEEYAAKVPHMSSTAGSVGTLGLRELVPAIPGQNPTSENGPRTFNRPAGEQETLSANIARSSRAVQAGCRLITLQTPPMQGEVTWERAGAFTVVSGADFTQGDDVNPLTVQGLPYSTEIINMDDLESYGVRFELSRHNLKHDFPGELNARIVTAIANGLPELVDRVVLAKLESEMLTANGGTLPSFSLAAAAAKGLRFGELSAIVGTAGTGAQYQDGRLRVSGVPAELTGENANTFVGPFDRCAVAIYDDIRVLVERLKADGSVAMTVWVDLLALAPDAGFFWSAS